MSSTFSRTEWIWPGWIPKGYVTIVVGQTGIGKSIMVLDLVDCLANPKKRRIFPDGSPNPLTTGQRILWLDTEGTEAILYERMEAWKVSDRNIKIVVESDEEGELLPINVVISDKEQRKDLRELVDRIAPNVVVVDSLTGTHFLDENKAEMKVIVRYFQDLVKNVDRTCIIVHHRRKAQKGEGRLMTLETLRGSSAIPQMARSIIAIDSARRVGVGDETGDEGFVRYVHQIKNTVGRPQKPLGFSIGDKGVKWISQPSVDVRELTQKVREAEIFLKGILGDGKPHSAVKILSEAKTLEISRSTLHRARSKMLVEVEKQGRMWYWILEEARTKEG